MGTVGVAANQCVFPKGLKLRITMSNGQVLERTVKVLGSLSYSNPRQQSVAMQGKDIPSAGVLSATV